MTSSVLESPQAAVAREVLAATESAKRVAYLLNTGVLATRVALGAAFLTQKLPYWFRNIDVDRTDIRVSYRKTISGKGCILCQLYGRYQVGADRLGISDSEAIGYGLMSSEADNELENQHLTRLWQAETCNRRRAG